MFRWKISLLHHSTCLPINDKNEQWPFHSETVFQLFIDYINYMSLKL